ncbi:hypothetical protein N7532_006438 [Penicillium argentinense]|uniref:Secreted protein n=1 Tax=Penicillium argentinense TaxID=1131581 RepID=A0A9W9KBY5_9EURO|nr:uncharacterized protein N7532_006438 [Penicillium argentinense]KAJ5099437.1 hypothetical protein N7532_006438 [Penicillium argentinense]
MGQGLGVLVALILDGLRHGCALLVPLDLLIVEFGELLALAVDLGLQSCPDLKNSLSMIFSRTALDLPSTNELVLLCLEKLSDRFNLLHGHLLPLAEQLVVDEVECLIHALLVVVADDVRALRGKVALLRDSFDFLVGLLQQALGLIPTGPGLAIPSLRISLLLQSPIAPDLSMFTLLDGLLLAINSTLAVLLSFFQQVDDLDALFLGRSALLAENFELLFELDGLLLEAVEDLLGDLGPPKRVVYLPVSSVCDSKSLV